MGIVEGSDPITLPKKMQRQKQVLHAASAT
jgi:hypothetical protein